MEGRSDQGGCRVGARWIEAHYKESTYYYYKQTPAPKDPAGRPLTAGLSNLDSQRARCGHRAGFSSSGHPRGVW